jgi:hypothetical protein
MALIWLSPWSTCESLRHGGVNSVARSEEDEEALLVRDATCIIDNMQQKLYQKWALLDDAKRSAMRAKFHDRKRYGKRWVILADGLGKAILLPCPPLVASKCKLTTRRSDGPVLRAFQEPIFFAVR